jgi:hypothetical protein
MLIIFLQNIKTHCIPIYILFETAENKYINTQIIYYCIGITGTKRERAKNKNQTKLWFLFTESKQTKTKTKTKTKNL